MRAPGEGDGFATGRPAGAWAPLSAALRAYDGGDEAAAVTVRNDADVPRSLPISHLFRLPAEFSAIDREALRRCRGTVLDIGAAVGAIALHLQEAGMEVTALDPIPEAVRIMRKRGLSDARVWDVFAFESEKSFDTVLLLMNGSMVAGTLAGLERLLRHLETLLSPRGQVLMDSTDLRDGPEVLGADGRYIGELHFQLEFEGTRGPPFPQLFVDPETLADVAVRAGLAVEVVVEGDEGAFLARLTRLPSAGGPGPDGPF